MRIKKSERRWQEEADELRRKRCKDEEEKKRLTERVSAMVDKCSGHFSSWYNTHVKEGCVRNAMAESWG